MAYKDPERKREYMAAYLAAHREQNKERCKQRYYAKKEEYHRTHQEWRAAHPDFDREDYQRNKERKLAQQKVHYQADRDRIIAQRQAYRDANKDKIRAYRQRPEIMMRDRLNQHKKRLYIRDAGSFTQEEWAIRVGSLGNKCYYCEGEWTTIDHMTPLARGGNNTIDNVVPACVTCNCKKGKKTVDEFAAWRANHTKAESRRSGKIVTNTV